MTRKTRKTRLRLSHLSKKHEKHTRLCRKTHTPVPRIRAPRRESQHFLDCTAENQGSTWALKTVRAENHNTFLIAQPRIRAPPGLPAPPLPRIRPPLRQPSQPAPRITPPLRPPLPSPPRIMPPFQPPVRPPPRIMPPLRLPLPSPPRIKPSFRSPTSLAPRIRPPPPPRKPRGSRIRPLKRSTNPKTPEFDDSFDVQKTREIEKQTTSKNTPPRCRKTHDKKRKIPRIRSSCFSTFVEKLSQNPRVFRFINRSGEGFGMVFGKPFSIGKPRSLSVMQRNKAPCLSVEPRDDDRAAHAPPHPTKASSRARQYARSGVVFDFCCAIMRENGAGRGPGFASFVLSSEEAPIL